jgi:hypothetical protein
VSQEVRALVEAYRAASVCAVVAMGFGPCDAPRRCRRCQIIVAVEDEYLTGDDAGEGTT